ncbi:sensor histidine kinase [Gordonia alkaliphila]|uniref:sensor histidine kinase n=1 Tax=Gordonia alkaliphila TaxID=1053547 RepID=UPI001FF1A8CE|nr:sensor histidine kinase [Gordonia alkaliphila]MCK0439894.1 sensor histidine kinase [Gordonia alkaliphila]
MPTTDRRQLTVDRYIQWGGHLLFAVLMAVGLLRAVQDTASNNLAAVLGATALAGWYLFGVMTITVRHKQIAVMWTLVLLAGWAVLTVFAPDFIWLAFVLAMLAWHFLPRALAIPAELVIAAVAVAASLATEPEGAGAVVGPVIGIATAVAVTEAVRRVIDASAARDALLQELASTQLRLAQTERETMLAAERERMGGEIHDGVGQALAGIVMLLQSATDRSSPPPQQRAQALTALDMATSALAQTRGFLRSLDTPTVAPDELLEGLSAAVEQARRLGLPTELHVHGDAAGLDHEVRATLLRTAQESLANAVRHAHAKRAVVTLTVLDDEVHLDVVDDGRGFDPSHTGGHGTGFGLAALLARVERAGGTATIETDLGDGTTIGVCLPLPTPTEGAR